MPDMAVRSIILSRIEILLFRRDWIARQFKSGDVTVALSAYAYENSQELDLLMAKLDEIDQLVLPLV